MFVTSKTKMFSPYVYYTHRLWEQNLFSDRRKWSNHRVESFSFGRYKQIHNTIIRCSSCGAEYIKSCTNLNMKISFKCYPSNISKTDVFLILYLSIKSVVLKFSTTKFVKLHRSDTLVINHPKFVKNNFNFTR